VKQTRRRTLTSKLGQCARRVGRIQNNGKRSMLHSAASGRRATRGGDWKRIVRLTGHRLLVPYVFSSEVHRPIPDLNWACNLGVRL
jgi:hypothetical protein